MKPGRFEKSPRFVLYSFIKEQSESMELQYMIFGKPETTRNEKKS